jgi:hypothetical protein
VEAACGVNKGEGSMRRNLLLVLALAGLLSIAVAAIATAKRSRTTVKAGNLVLTFGGGISPTKLPKNKYVPVTAELFGKISTDDGTHPSA